MSLRPVALWMGFGVMSVPLLATGADQPEKKYFSHFAVEDRYGVIAPWYTGQNGQCDFRVRVAVGMPDLYPGKNGGRRGRALRRALPASGRRLALARLARAIEGQCQMTDDEDCRHRWLQHSEIERGDPIRVCDGPRFTRKR